MAYNGQILGLSRDGWIFSFQLGDQLRAKLGSVDCTYTGSPCQVK